jgi:succinate dehydrogenase / fumarate reductase flavoprotein subunit
MNKHLAVFREQKGMEQALSTIGELKERYKSVYVPDKGKTFNTNLIFTLELGFMLECAEAICLGALERKESRGAHTRTDMPDRDDENWMKHILVSRSDEGPKIEYRDVVITQWEPQIRSY